MRAQAKRSSAVKRGGSDSRSSVNLVIGLLLAALALLALAPSAPGSVTTRYPMTASFGADGTALTTFENAGSLAFDQAADRLFVVDPGSPPLLHAFDTLGLTLPGGAFPKILESAGFGSPITVDNTAGASAGHIFYVAEEKLFGFDANGTALGGNFPVSLPSGGLYTGAAIDSAGNIYVSNGDTSAQNIREYSSDGTFLATISTSALGGPGRLAFDSNDDLIFEVLLLGGGTAGAYKYTAASGYSPASVTTLFSGGNSPTPITVDASSHTLYVADDKKVFAHSVTTGAFLYEFANNIASAGFSDVTVDEGTDTVYVSDAGNNKVYAFGPAQTFADATATLNPASAITDSGASISAQINDNNLLPTRWRLELSADGGTTWTAKGSGITASKSAAVAGAGTLTVKAAGGTFTLSFQGKATPPLAYDASAADVQAALEALSTIGAGNVVVADGPGSPSGSTPYSITFTGALAGTSVAQIGANPDSLVGPPVTVSQALTGLNPNSSYQFRVVTNKGTDASTEVVSSSVAFKTVAPPPVITDVGAVQVTDTSARLVATIDPRNTETEYVFEYGTTPALGSSTAPLDIGGGTTPITVSQVIGGLSPDTTYYFRAVATNPSGTTQSPNATFTTRATPLPLPSGRAYEQVTPVDKNYGDADVSPLGLNNKVDVSVNGNAVANCTMTSFGDPPSRMTSLCAPYISRRSAGGWQTPVGDFPEYCHIDAESGNEEGFLAVIPSADYSRTLYNKPESASCPIPPLDPAAPLLAGEPSFNLYWQDAADPDSYQLLSTEAMGIAERAMLQGGSDDFSHVVFGTETSQTPDSPPGSFQKLYEWDNGTLRLLSVDPNGDPLTARSSVPQMRTLPVGSNQPASAVSHDGERIYFDSPHGGGCTEAGCELYMREGGTVTHDVSASECAVDCGSPQEDADFFLSASGAGDKAFFTSCAKLTDESSAEGCFIADPWAEQGTAGSPGAKLYRWDLSGSPGHHLIDLTVDEEPSDGSEPDFFGLIGHSNDGETAYFVTRSQIVAGEPTFPVSFFNNGAGGPGSAIRGAKLYRWRWNGGSPSTDYIGPYQGLVPGKTGFSDYNLLQQHRQVSADGKYLTVYTEAAIDPAADRDSDADVYRWEEEGGWICASCQLPGAPSGGDVDLSELGLVNNAEGEEMLGVLKPKNLMSEDGQRIFFGTPDALVPEDVNGEAECPRDAALLLVLSVDVYACNDVYEWHDGKVNLISSGTGTGGPVRLIDATPTGKDVFFYTRERMVGWDPDNNVDIYDARIGGGFPEPPPQPPPCEGEGCRDAGTSAPPATGAGTAAFQGPGNPKAQSPKGCPKGKRQVRRKGKTRCVAKARKHQHKRAANKNQRTGR